MATSYRVGSASLRVFPDMTGFHSRVAQQTRGMAVDIRVNADQGGLRTFASELSALGRSTTVQINVDAGRARVELAGVEHAVQRFSGRTWTANLNLDVVQVLRGVAIAAIAVNQFVNRKYELKVDADVSGAAANIARLVATVGALGGGIGIVGGLVGALGGVAPAAGGAMLGVLPLVKAFGGVGGAVKALSDQQTAAGTSAQGMARKQAQAANQITSAQLSLSRATRAVNEARRDGAREVAQAEQQAERAVAQARQQAAAAAREVEQAVRSQRAAQRDLSSATTDLRFAQDQLNASWVEGRRALQDLQDQADGVALDQRQNTLDLADARDRLREAQAGGDTREIERAQLAVDRLIEQQDVLAKRAERTNEANTKGQAAGVAGTEQVIAARQRVVAAEDAVTAARERAQLADQAVSDARARQAEADAAIDVARADGAASVALAKEMAGRRITSAEESAADAARQLAMAQLAATDAATAGADKVAKAFADLTPSQAAFARYWFGLKPTIDGLTKSFASRFFPGLIRGIDAVVKRSPELNGMFAILGTTFGLAAEQILKTLSNPTWTSFFQLLTDQAAIYLPQLITTFFMFADVVRILITSFVPFTPVALQVLGLFAQLLQVLAPVVATFLGGLIPVAGLFIQALMPLAPLLLALLPVFQVLGGVLAEVLLVALQALTPILVALTPLIAEFALQWGEHLVKAITTFTPLLVHVFTFLSEHAETVAKITTAVLAFHIALNPLAWIMGILLTIFLRFLIVRTITQLLLPLGAAGRILTTVFTFLLNPLGALGSAFTFLRAMLPHLPRLLLAVGRAILTMLGPVGVAITVFTVLYSSSETFRGAVNGLLLVFGQLISQVVSALLPALMSIIDALAPLVPLIIGALVPVFDALIGVLVEIINAILPPLVGLLTGLVIPVIKTLADILATVLVWTIKNLVVPVLQFVADVIKNVVVPVIVWLANTIVVPLFKLIGQIITWVWTTLLKPAFDAWVVFLRTILGPAVLWLWDNIVKPAFNGIGTLIMWVWDNLIKPAFFSTQNGLTELGRFFDTTVAGIRSTWNTLKEILAVPINFLIETIWNNGIVPAWNAVDRFLGGALPDAVTLQPIRFASGGVLPGYRPGVDTIPAILFPGEAIMRPEWTRAVGRKQINQMNRAAKKRGVRGVQEYMAFGGEGPAQFAGGGVAGGQAWARSQQGKPYVWGGVGPGGYDCSGFMSAITNYLLGTGLHSRRFATGSFGPNRGAGGFVPGTGSAFVIGVNPNTVSGVGHMAGTLGGLNVESRGGQGVVTGGGARGADNGLFPWRFFLPQAGGSFTSGGAGGSFSVANPLAEGAKALLGTLGSAAKGLLDKIAAPPPEWMAVPKGLGTKMVDGLTTFATAKIDTLFPPLMGGGGIGGGAAGPGSGPVVDQVRGVANRYGWGAGPQWDALSRLIQKESSWNPNAQNPSSTAYGLFQFLNSTWGSVGGSKTSNPAQQAEYGLRYIKQRYRDPAGALAFHLRNNWYSDGGIVPGLFDNGGWLKPGISVVHNATGQPEPVLNPAQWNTVASLAQFTGAQAAVTNRQMAGVGAGGPQALIDRYEQHFHGDQQAEQAMSALDHQLRVIRRRV